MLLQSGFEPRSPMQAFFQFDLQGMYYLYNFKYFFYSLRTLKINLSNFNKFIWIVLIKYLLNVNIYLFVTRIIKYLFYWVNIYLL